MGPSPLSRVLAGLARTHPLVLSSQVLEAAHRDGVRTFLIALDGRNRPYPS